MGIEIKILDFIQTIQTPVCDSLMLFITRLGDMGILWIMLALILLFMPSKRKTGVMLVAALFLDLILCNGILKNVVARIRPFDINTSVELLIAKPTDFSFPSGHTAVSFAAVAALSFAKEKKLWKMAFVFAVLIAFSRLYLYVHYPTDILGGIAVGTAAGYFGFLIVDMLTRWNMEKKR